MPTPDHFNQLGADTLPGHLGLVFTHVSATEVRSELAVKPVLMAPNGFLHTGSIVTLADTSAGYGCVANLPEGATGFTTIELKTNFLSTIREGAMATDGRMVHGGRTTQLWDVEVRDEASGKSMALFRCTQLILYPRD